LTSSKGRILAIDPGKVRIGLAICDADRTIASPLAQYTRRDAAQDAKYFKTLVAEEKVGSILIGLPVYMSGDEGPQAKVARAFGKLVEEWTTLPVRYWDERYTTRFAETMLWDAGLTHKKRKERRDQVAAQILLASYLEAGCPDADATPPAAL
jgi:putative Holliday junction resolvase